MYIIAGSRENYPAVGVIFQAVKGTSHLKKDLLSLLNVSRGISAVFLYLLWEKLQMGSTLHPK